MDKGIKKWKRKLILLVSLILVVIIAATVVLQNMIGSAMMKHTDYEWKYIKYHDQENDSADPAFFSDNNPVVEDYVKTAETESLILYLRSDSKAIKVYDKRSQRVWDSVVDQTEIVENEVGEYYSVPMQSLFTFDYIDLSNITVEEQTANLFQLEAEITAEKIKNGVRVNYYFPSLSVGLAIDFCLVNDELQCKIADSGISENDDQVEKIEKIKNEIQGKISAFQDLTDSFQSMLEKTKIDELVLEMVRIYVNEIYNLLVEIKETAGTQNFDEGKLETVSEDIENISLLITDSEEISEALEEMKQHVSEILDDTVYLRENQAIGITKLNFMPYFGSALKSDDGYVFYPDKNGAISYFDVPHPDASGSFSQDIYDEFAPVPSYNTKVVDDTNKIDSSESSCMYPVYGIKKGSSAFAAVIVQGEYDSTITYNPITSFSHRANAYTTFNMRKTTVYTNESGGTYSLYDKKRSAHDWGIVYKFLNGEQADYSGMAAGYREMLLENGLLRKTDIMDGEMPLATSFFMGVESYKDSLTRNYIKFTEWNDISEYLKTMSDNGIESNMVNIEYWTHSAGKDTNDNVKPAGETGSISDLRQLTDMSEDGNIIISLEKKFLSAAQQDLSFLESNNATVKSINMLSVESYGWNLLNPYYVFNRQMSDLKNFKKYGNNGITYSDIGSSLFYDYNSKGVVERNDTAAILERMVSETKKDIPYAVIPNASSLYFDEADWITGISSESSGYMFTDESVPFYQMVVHGYIPYTSSALNEVSDTQLAKLKRIEYGEIPFYSLTKILPPEKKSEYIGGLYSSQIEDWQDYIIEDYQAYSGELGSCWNAVIEKHEKLSEKVYKTVFSNGTAVIVNYNENEVTTGSGTVGARDYIITEAQQ